jgi:hypothetical protein
MKKVETVISYNGATFKLAGEVRDLKVYIDPKNEDYCIITYKDGNVLIEIASGKSQGYSYLSLIVNEE